MISTADILKFFDHVQSLYPKFVVDTEQVRLWQRVLADFEVESLYRAIDKHAGESRFEPSLAEIKQRATELGGKISHYSTVPEKWLATKNSEHWRNGLVPAHRDGKFWAWYPKERCIQTGGKWLLKVDFCVDQLGAGKVNELLRSELNWDLSDGVDRFSTSGYMRILDQITALAKTAEESALGI